MKRILLSLMASCFLSAQAADVYDYTKIQNNNAYNREQLRSEIQKDTAPLAKTSDLQNLPTKNDLTTAIQGLQSAIVSAIQGLSNNGGGSTPTPTPSQTPAPVNNGHAGIFIGSTEYGSLGDAAAALKQGDVLHLTKSLDNDSVALVNAMDYVVQCDAGVALTWSAGLNKRVAWGKGIFNVEGQAKSFSIKGCEIAGAVLNGPDGGNASCVRLNDTMPSATFDTVYFHGCNDGILGGAKTINIVNSKFDGNGVNSGGYANVHGIYISAYTDTLNISGSYFGHVTPAHLVKSRAKTTNITYTQFENTLDGSYCIDAPNGGAVSVTHSVFVKGAASQRGAMGYGEEGIANDGRQNSYLFQNNVFINDGNARFMDGSLPSNISFANNTVVGPAMDNADALNNGTNNKMCVDRASAGIQAAPFLPVPN